ncbi:hypothetical protein GOODEAATRI_027561 [Goodea atripinnis]|uniref:Uncharacterized protein n=1 Tax=Goodea atripinnis TaxID=208336 RepID=A0ABV0PS91_9TELE
MLGCTIWIRRKAKSSDITVEQTCVATSANAYKDKEHAETEDKAFSVQHANPTETPDTLDHSLKSDACYLRPVAVC